jgi:hypothetical protein
VMPGWQTGLLLREHYGLRERERQERNILSAANLLGRDSGWVVSDGSAQPRCDAT